MTTLKLQRKEFEKHIPLTEKNIEKISLFGTPLESITDDEVEIEIFPNRPDLLSFHTYIKQFKVFLGKEKLSVPEIKKPLLNYKVKIDSSVKKVRPFTACAIVKNLSLNDEKIREIIDLQEKLHTTLGRNRKKVAIGIYPLEKITLPIIYKAEKPEKIKFTPLEEKREMTGRQILQRHPTGREYAHLLENEEKFPIFIDGKSEILSMPPIINSEMTGRITEKTKDVFIECSGFSLEVLQKTLSIIVFSLGEMGGEVYKMVLNYDNKKILTPNFEPQKIKISLENVNKLLGLRLKESELFILLRKMGHNYKTPSVFVPAWRTDILHEVDIIEDIAIAYGYNNFSPEVPSISTIAEENKNSQFINKLANILVGLGFIETLSYNLLKKNEAELMSLTDFIEVEDSKTEYKILRPHLLTSSLRTLSENKDKEYPQNIFEIGTVFSPDEKQETKIKETKNLIIISSPANFTKMKSILNYLLAVLGISYQIGDGFHRNLTSGRAAEIKIGGKEIGFMGELHPETLRVWGIKMPVAVAEISLDEIFSLLS